MIVLLEPICSSWIHEEANAGFLQIVDQNCTERIVFIAEKEHVHCIRRIYRNDDIDYVIIKNPVKKDDSDNFVNLFYYVKLLKEVMLKFRPEKLFILCAYRPCILAAEMISILFHKVDINIILHGMVEKYKGHYDSYKSFFYLSEFCKKLRFITYSPFCTGAHWNIDDEKIVFVDQHFIGHRVNKKRIEGSKKKIIIGILGACANEKAKKIIMAVNQHELNVPYEFWVASKYGQKFRHMENVKVLGLEFDRKEKYKLLQQFDYLLLPYDKDEYALSASGVLWDAILNKIPCFMLGSDYCKYYMQYKIGYQADNIKDLCKIIFERLQRAQGDNPVLFVGLDKIDKNRIETMKSLLS